MKMEHQTFKETTVLTVFLGPLIAHTVPNYEKKIPNSTAVNWYVEYSHTHGQQKLLSTGSTH